MTSTALALSQPLSPDELAGIDAYWRACNYLAAGMIYLRAHPLLREPLAIEHIKQRLLGHWGASPGLAFTYVHTNRLIREHDLNAIFIAGPGHGAPGVLAPVYLEGSFSEIYPDISEDEEGLARLFRHFSFRVVLAATVRRSYRAQFTKAANSATACPTPSAPLSTTPTSSLSPLWAMARPRPGRWPPPGTQTSSCIPSATAPFFR